MTGKLVAPPDAHWNLSETKGLLMQDLPAFPIPPDVKSKGRRTQDEWFQKWKLTEEGQAFLSQPRKKYDLCVGSDGSFSIANVVPGDCWLCYSFHDPLENELVCMGKKTFSLSAGSTPFASGDIQMTVRPHLKNGERAPRFQATAVDGTPVNLDSCKGRTVFVHFWSTECAPCMAEMPLIMKTYNELGDNSGFVMFGFNLDSNPQKARDYIARKKLAWPQVLLGSWNHELMREFCVVGIPSNFLLDGQRRVVAKHLPGDQLSREVQRCLAGAKASGTTGNRPDAPAAR